MNKFKYPPPDVMEINEADLYIKLKKYQELDRKNFCLLDLLFILPAWIPIFTSDFNDKMGVSGSVILGAYVVIILMGTFFWLFNAKIELIKLYKRYIKKDNMWLLQNERNTNNRIINLKNQCRKSK